MIIAVKTKRELKKNSNILLSSVALADLLVGAVSMPLSITSDALVIQRVLVRMLSVRCFSQVSLFCILFAVRHLLLIAWERYAAVAK